LIRTKNKIYGEINDPNTVLLSENSLADMWLIGKGNKAIGNYAPGANKILIIDNIDNIFYLSTLTWYGQSDGLIGTDENGDIVLISKTTPGLILNDEDVINDTYPGGIIDPENPTISYIDWDYSVIKTASYAVDVDLTAFTVPSDPTRTGYTFVGWNTVKPSIMPAYDIIITAQYTINQYTATFETNGGSTIPLQTVNYASALTNPGTPSKTGYAFVGWFTDVSLTTAYSGFGTPMLADIILYAKWTIVQYTISYVDWDSSVIKTGNYAYGDDLTVFTAPTDPTRTGYTFTNWSITKPSTMPASNLTITAQYTINQYTATFNTNGGNVIDPQTVNYAGALTNPGTPILVGYYFVGWFTDVSLTTAYSGFGTPTLADITLYAKWLEIFLVAFDTNGGSWVDSQDVVDGDYATQPSDPTLSGYTFGGWFNLGVPLTDPFDFGIPITYDTAVYAKWLENYDITYSLNGGTNNVNNVATFNSSDLDVTLYAPTKSDYLFGGWYTDSGFTTPIASITAVGDITIYAKWLTLYNITYSLDGGTNNFENLAIFTENDLNITLLDPSKSYYIFDGWYTNSSFTTQITEITSIGNKIVYAKWVAVDYNITYELDGGTNSASNNATFTVLDLDVTIYSPTRVGYTFIGWFRDAEFTTPITYITATGDITVYAKWGAITYYITYELDGGSNAVFNPRYFKEYDLPITLLGAAKDNYSFLGWFTSPTLTTEITEITTIGNKIVYAKFEPIS